MPLMTGFPPPAEGQVTLANWRTAPFNRWGFQHVREIVPSADPSRHSPPMYSFFGTASTTDCSFETTLMSPPSPVRVPLR